jgi:hypothetical protein
MKQNRPSFLVLNTEPIHQFREGNSKLTALGEDLLWLEWQLCSLVAHLGHAFTPITAMCMQQLHDYHREASLLCMRDRANVALALVRMACELSRDLVLMSRDPTAEQLWLDREDLGKQYRKHFRFDRLTSPVGSALRDLYKIGCRFGVRCRFGVHGHVHYTDEPTERVSNAGKEFLLLPANHSVTLSCYSLNLAAMQTFMYAFLEQHSDPFRTAADIEIRAGASQIVHHLGKIEIPFYPTPISSGHQ